MIVKVKRMNRMYLLICFCMDAVSNIYHKESAILVADLK
jgi:hypothetical protein